MCIFDDIDDHIDFGVYGSGYILDSGVQVSFSFSYFFGFTLK